MSYLRTFVLLKEEGSSGAGGGRIAAIGAVMPSGSVVLEWTNGTRGIALFHSIDAVLAAQNGHDRNVLRWGLGEDDE
jgi:hypothetical protein